MLMSMLSSGVVWSGSQNLAVVNGVGGRNNWNDEENTAEDHTFISAALVSFLFGLSPSEQLAV
jgi:hypothetical protein